MNPETFPHRRDGLLQACRCGTPALCGIGATFGENCPAALREALAWQEDRHGTRAEQEREEADLAAEMAAVEAMSDDEINASLDAAGVDRALADRKCDALVRVCVERLALVMKLENAERERDAAVARVAELETTLANERATPSSAAELLARARDAVALSGNGFLSIFSADGRWFAAVTQVRDRRHAAALLRWRGGGAP